MKNKDKFFCSPPRVTRFKDLFKYFWDHGVGNDVSESGTPTPWTEESLEGALMSMGRDISLRSIQNWRRGKIPSRRNIHVLACIASGDSPVLQKEWREQFFESTQSTRTAATPVPVASAPNSLNTSLLITPIVVGAAIAFGVIGLAFGFSQSVLSNRNVVNITDLKFCSEQDFSTDTKRCLRPTQVYDTAAPIIYVSFESDNVPYGHPFERRWYHQGQMFIQRDGFFDEAWENYTWVKMEELKGPGKYVLRIIVDGKVTTESFVITPRVAP